MKKIYTLLICICALLHANAQYDSDRNKIWAFGYGAGIDFTSGSPVPFSSSIHTREGCASMCNTSGSLLFYTEGRTVYNRLGLAMPSGPAIVPFPVTWTTTQGALIVPFINDGNKYYVFSLEPISTTGRLAYSIIDMTLDGGFGDVVPGSAGIMIDSEMTEKMIAVPGDSCNVWVLAHKRHVAQFYAYEITSSGLNATPVVSNVGTFAGPYGYEGGVIKCSPNRQKIVSASSNLYTMGWWGLELYDFDPATGVVSNCRVLDANPTVDNYYGAEFSPDNTRLYTSSMTTPTCKIHQWYVLPPSTPMIISSKTLISSSTTSIYADMKLGVDGKIYVSRSQEPFLDCINFPNASGAGCGFVPDAVSTLPDTAWHGLPNLVWNTMSISGASAICLGTSTSLAGSVTGGTWSSSDPGVATISSTGLVTPIAVGTSIISYLTGSSCNQSSIVITVNPSPAAILGPTTIVIGSSATLTNATAGGTWSSSDIAKVTVNSTGKITGVALGTSTIYYTLPNGCRVSVLITVVKNTSVSAIETPTKPTLYPNPAANEITITADPTEFTSFTIFNALGQELIKCEITSIELKVDVKAFPPGQYLVIFKGDTQREIARFVKW